MPRKRPRDNDVSGADVPARRDDITPSAPKGSLEATLEITAGPNKGETIVLERIVTLIGRGDGCDIVLEDTTVSREHGQIEQAVGQWVYTNFSENATWINRKQVERVALSDGDTIEIGSKTRMRFRLAEPRHVEAVAPVRRRVRRTQEEIEAELTAPAEEEAAASLGGELAKRRKTLILVGVYLVAMVILFAGLVIAGKGEDKDKDNGLTMYKKEDLVKWLNKLDFGMPPNVATYNREINNAVSLYDAHEYGDKMDLYKSVEAFQRAYECNDRMTFDDPKHFNMFRDAKKKLVDTVWELYRAAVRAHESRHNFKEAQEFYREILRRLPADAPFYKHVMKRMSKKV